MELNDFLKKSKFAAEGRFYPRIVAAEGVLQGRELYGIFSSGVLKETDLQLSEENALQLKVGDTVLAEGRLIRKDGDCYFQAVVPDGSRNGKTKNGKEETNE